MSVAYDIAECGFKKYSNFYRNKGIFQDILLTRIENE